MTESLYEVKNHVLMVLCSMYLLTLTKMLGRAIMQHSFVKGETEPREVE